MEEMNIESIGPHHQEQEALPGSKRHILNRCGALAVDSLAHQLKQLRILMYEFCETVDRKYLRVIVSQKTIFGPERSGSE